MCLFQFKTYIEITTTFENKTVIDMSYKTVMEVCDELEINCTGVGLFSLLTVVLMIIGVLLILLGIVGNSVPIVMIRLRVGFHTATYTTVALLALVKLFAVCLRIVNVVDIFHDLLGFGYIMSFKALCGFLTATFATYVSSCTHVVILARLKCWLTQSMD